MASDQPLLSASPPRFFYRVQHEDSRTIMDPCCKFRTRRNYDRTNYGKIVTAERLLMHLDWHNRSPIASPFISVFDNKADADARALMHRDEWGHSKTRVAKIGTSTLRHRAMELKYGHRSVIIPVWAKFGPDNTIFFSTLDARRYLGIPSSVGQLSEWFAVEFISSEMVEDVRYLPERVRQPEVQNFFCSWHVIVEEPEPREQGHI